MDVSEHPLGEYFKRLPNFRRMLEVSDEELEELEREEEERRQQEWRRRCRQAWHDFSRPIGPDYAECRLSTFQCYEDQAIARQQQVIVGSLQHYAEQMRTEVTKGRNVILFGPSGTGKDHLLTGLCRVAILKHQYAIKWIRGSRFYLEARQAMGEQELEFVQHFSQRQILYLSDPLPPIGSLTSHQASMLYEVVDERYRQKRPTWVTLNVTDRMDAEQRLGTSIVDRLAENALDALCDWPSYRRDKGGKHDPPTQVHHAQTVPVMEAIMQRMDRESDS